MSPASFTIFLKDAPLNPSFKKCLSAVSNIFPWFSLPLLTYDSSSNAVKNITMLYHTVILILSIDIVKNTHDVLLDFFSLKPEGTGAMDLLTPSFLETPAEKLRI